MAGPMYDRQVEVINQFKDELRRELPEAFSYLDKETEGAATGLEYYGMLRSAIKQAMENGLIPKSYAKKVRKTDDAIRYIFES